jgi:D-alanyl-D-alanine carboxypeptidase/D-alanyl-D-alanine-endopeptidase (penicillin-binding protein 4)
MVRLAALITLLMLALAPAADAAGLSATRRVLAREMARAGASSGAYVLDLDRDQELFASRPDVGRMPASVEKLYTSSTALLLYGSEGRLSTGVLADSLPDETGTIAGNVVLRGGGDPTFGTATAQALANKLAAAGVTRIDGRVIGDEAAGDTFRGPPSSSYQVSSDVGPLSALSFNHGRTGKRRPFWQPSPAKFAAQAFSKALKKAGVKITGSARAGTAGAGMTPLSEWVSPTLATIVQAMNQPSDNYMAETLIKDLGAEFGAAGSTAAGARVVTDTVKRFEVAPVVRDGSGLSRGDRTTPRQVVGLLKGMAESEAAEAFDASLPVVGRNGTMYKRMRGTAAQDRCHTKTGTLHDVSALAGYCTTTGGEHLAFAFLMNRVNPLGAHVLQDKMTVALARYNAP